jgi:hypothetical protein
VEVVVEVVDVGAAEDVATDTTATRKYEKSSEVIVRSMRARQREGRQRTTHTHNHGAMKNTHPRNCDAETVW